MFKWQKVEFVDFTEFPAELFFQKLMLTLMRENLRVMYSLILCCVNRSSCEVKHSESHIPRTFCVFAFMALKKTPSLNVKAVKKITCRVMTSLHKLMCCQSLFIIKWTRKEDIWQLKCLLLMNVYFPKLLKFWPSDAGVPSLHLMPDFTLMFLQLELFL